MLSSFIRGFGADLPAPQPTELDEPEPQAAPGEPNKLPEQPRPEPESPQDLGKVCVPSNPNTLDLHVFLISKLIGPVGPPLFVF